MLHKCSEREKFHKNFQDYFGSFGLYVYRCGEDFAISNSFLYLVNYLKTRKIITFDNIFAESLISVPQASLAYKRTMIKEIEMLPKNYSILVDMDKRTLEYEQYVQNESCVDINSKEGIRLIDAWHQKWNRIFKILCKSNENVIFSLSGGKDSRVSLACLLDPKVELKRIEFFTAQDKLYTHKDDLEIAIKIAKIYNFQLNKKIHLDTKYRMDPVENLNASLLIKCGFHREIMVTYFWKVNTIFRITGSGGDLRELWNELPDEFIKRNVEGTIFNSVGSDDALLEILMEDIEQIDREYRQDNQVYNACDYFYKHARQRNHNGKANAECFLSNEIILSPLMDPLLYKINQDIGKENDRDLLYAVIYDRFLPELKDVWFDSGRIILKETREIAQAINKAFPKHAEEKKDEKVIEIDVRRIPPHRSGESKNALDCLKQMFYSDEVRNFVLNEFGEEVYKWADEYYRKDYHPYIAASGLVQIFLIRRAADLSRYTTNYFLNDELRNDTSLNRPRLYRNNGIVKEVLDFLQACRIEVKHFGDKDNDVLVDKIDDENCFVEAPTWLCDDMGKGKCIQSVKGRLLIKLQIKGKGNLVLKFKGPWVKDNMDNVLSVKIDLIRIKLFLNQTAIYQANECMTVDSLNPVIVETRCLDGDEILMDIEWFPFIYPYEEFAKIYRELTRKSINYYRFWKGMK